MIILSYSSTPALVSFDIKRYASEPRSQGTRELPVKRGRGRSGRGHGQEAGGLIYGAEEASLGSSEDG